MFQSTTKGVLHFEDLSPQQFEDLYRNILHITGDYQDIRAYGIKGSDDGVSRKIRGIHGGGYDDIRG